MVSKGLYPIKIGFFGFYAHHSNIPLFPYSMCGALLRFAPHHLINSLGGTYAFCQAENKLPIKVTPKAKKKQKRA